MAYSPDGRTIVSTSSDDTIRLWDVAAGKEIRKILDFNGFYKRLSYSPDGKYVVGYVTDLFSSSEIVKFHEVQTGNVVKQFTGEYRGKLLPGKTKGRISPDGKTILMMYKNYFALKEVATDREIWRAITSFGDVVLLTFTPDGHQILAVCEEKKSHLLISKFTLLDAATGNQIKEFTAVSGGGSAAEYIWYQMRAIAFSPDGRFALSGDNGGHYRLWDISTGKMVRQLKVMDEISGTIFRVIPSLAFSPDGRTAVVSSLASIRLYDVLTGDELATMIAFKDGEWLVITPTGYYNSSEKGDQYLSITVGGQQYSIAQLRESFYRPDLVKIALSGESLKDFRKMSDIKQPPVVLIVNTPSRVDKDEVNVTLKIVDTGGGIGDIRLYLNGSAVMLDSASRGINIVPTHQNEVYKTYTLKLTNGLNSIRAIAFNDDNTMQSSDTVYQITALLKTFARPSVYAIVIGINNYKNPKLQLNYAVADAGLFSDVLKQAAAGLFEKVSIKMLTTNEETSRENIIRELKAVRSLNPDDVFVFYVASHGTVDEGEYYLISSNVGSTRTEKLKTDAISQTVFKEMIANIPATKKLIIIDTCNAGALGSAIQTVMLTRGMSEDTAMKILSRAIGSTILSASTPLQEALEGYKGHGLFTFVLSDGLSGKADKNKSGYIKTTDLADYVDNEVPLLAEKVYNKAQYPMISISGQSFPIGKVK